jgi:penicillin-binding protein 2D
VTPGGKGGVRPAGERDPAGVGILEGGRRVCTDGGRRDRGDPSCSGLMQGVIDEGTGRSARSLGARGAPVGKTGTTDEYRDTWFIGYTPRRATGIWVGFDNGEVVGLFGASAALPIWAAAMRASEGPQGDGEFPRPPGITSAVICPESGLLATSDCPSSREDVFAEGSEPTESCDLQGGAGGSFDRIGKFFGF